MMGRENPPQASLFYTGINLEKRVRSDHVLRKVASWGNGISLRLFTFDIVNPRQPDDPLNSSKDNRYLTVFFASRPDGDLNVMAERDQKVH